MTFALTTQPYDGYCVARASREFGVAFVLVDWHGSWDLTHETAPRLVLPSVLSCLHGQPSVDRVRDALEWKVPGLSRYESCSVAVAWRSGARVVGGVCGRVAMVRVSEHEGQRQEILGPQIDLFGGLPLPAAAWGVDVGPPPVVVEWETEPGTVALLSWSTLREGIGPGTLPSDWLRLAACAA